MLNEKQMMNVKAFDTLMSLSNEDVEKLVKADL
jgi:hypothetical protein